MASKKCNGKQGFVSRKRAEHRARQMRRVFEKALEPYACRECGGWHIGGFLFPRSKRPERRCVQIMVGGLDAS